MKQFSIFLLLTVACSCGVGFALAFLAKLLINRSETALTIGPEKAKAAAAAAAVGGAGAIGSQKP